MLRKLRFGIIEFSEGNTKTLEKVYNIDKRLSKETRPYQIIREVESPSQLEEVYKELTTGIKIDKQREPAMFSPEYNKLHKIYYLGIDNPLRCMYISSSELGNLEKYIGQERRWLLTPNYDEYSKWYEQTVKAKLNKSL